jgi:hypothetical protein
MISMRENIKVNKKVGSMLTVESKTSDPVD